MLTERLQICLSKFNAEKTCQQDIVLSNLVMPFYMSHIHVRMYQIDDVVALTLAHFADTFWRMAITYSLLSVPLSQIQNSLCKASQMAINSRQESFHCNMQVYFEVTWHPNCINNKIYNQQFRYWANTWWNTSGHVDFHYSLKYYKMISGIEWKRTSVTLSDCLRMGLSSVMNMSIWDAERP